MPAMPRSRSFFFLFDLFLLVQPRRPRCSHIVKAQGRWLAPHGLGLLLRLSGWLLARSFICVISLLIVGVIVGNARYLSALVLLHVGQGFISAVNGFVLLYESHMKQRLLNKMIDKKLAQSASRGVWFLRLGAFLTLLDAVYLPLVETYSYSDSEHEIHLSPALFLTFDNSVVLASILILGGLIGPRDRLDPIEVMAELEHIARTQGKRIAFPGKLNRHSKHCIVSFPGKYSSET